MTIATVISIPPRQDYSPTLRNYLKAIRDSFDELDCSNLTTVERDDLYARMPPICAFITYPSTVVPAQVMRVGDLTRAQRSKLILWLTLSRSKPLLDGAERFLAGQIPDHDPAGYMDFEEGRRISEIIRRLLDAIIGTPPRCA
jgi:hypothetical protein